MSKTPEQRTHDWLKALPPDFDLQRIETSTTNGVPDLNLIVGGKEIWLEIKALPESKFRGIKVRKEQFAWMMRRTNRRGRCAVLNRKEDGTWDLWLMKPGGSFETLGDGHVRINGAPDASGSSIKQLQESLISATCKPTHWTS